MTVFCELPVDLLDRPVEAWAKRYFGRKASPNEPKNEEFARTCADLDEFEGQLPEPALNILLTRIAELHERYAEWGWLYSAAQLSQGLWAMFSFPGFFGEALRESDAPFELRARAMRSLVTPYRDYVMGWNPQEEMPHGWQMLWDLVLDDKRSDMDDVALGCLQEILALPDARCQAYALHGLNHLPHPERTEVVQRFIDRHGQGWNREWLEACRDGKGM